MITTVILATARLLTELWTVFLVMITFKIYSQGSGVAQGLTNPTRNHEVAGLIPGLAQGVKVLALLWYGSQMGLGSCVAVAVV